MNGRRPRPGGLLALICGGAVWFIRVWYQGIPETGNIREWCRILSNGALIPGVLFVGISALSWIAGDGMFDGLKYCMDTMMIHLRGDKKKYGSYYDYTQRKKKRGNYPMLLPGIFFLGAAVVLTLLYHSLGR